MKALGDVKDLAVVAVVGFIAWIVYKLVKQAPEGLSEALVGKPDKVTDITTSDGRNIRVTGRIIKPAPGGTAEYTTTFTLKRGYAVSASISNRTDQALRGSVVFEASEPGAGVMSSDTLEVDLAAGASKIIDATMQVGTSLFLTPFSPVPAVLNLYWIAGGEKRPIALPVQFEIV